MTEGKYRLYGRPNAGSLALQIALEEIGAPYELSWVSKAPAEAEAFRKINPTGKVPALMLPDGTVVFESAAILIHLANVHPGANLAPAAGTSAHARFLQWVLFLSANVYESALRLYYPDRYSSLGATAAPQIKERAVADYIRHLELIHGALSPYVLGETFSAVDPYLHMLAGWYDGDVAALHARLPKLARHAALLRERASTRKAERDHES